MARDLRDVHDPCFPTFEYWQLYLACKILACGGWTGDSHSNLDNYMLILPYILCFSEPNFNSSSIGVSVEIARSSRVQLPWSPASFGH
jgi:hypothetical protein